MNPKTLIFILNLSLIFFLGGVRSATVYGDEIEGECVDDHPDAPSCDNSGGGGGWTLPPVQTRSYAELEAERRGKEHWANKNWAQAIAEYELAHSYCQFSCNAYLQNITWATVYFHEAVGDRYWAQKNWDGVIRAYIQALNFCTFSMDCGWLRRDISRAQVYQQTAIGGRYFNQKNWLDAIYYYEAGLRLCIPSMDCNWIRNNISAAEENHKNQIARMGRDTWDDAGSNYWDNENWPAAISAYKEALRHCNSSMDCRYLNDNIRGANVALAADFWNEGRWAEAIPAYQEALLQCNIVGDNCSYLTNDITSARRNIERDKAQRFIENGNWVAAESAARAAARYCNPQVSCSNVTDMVPRARRDFEFEKAQGHWKNENWEAAIRDYKAALAQCTSRMDCAYIQNNIISAGINFDNQDFKRGREAYDQGNFEEALEFYEKALEKNQVSWALNTKGYILSELGRDDEALEAYALAYIKDPSNLSAAWNVSINLGPEDIDLKIMLLENSLLINSEESNSEIYTESLALLEDFKNERSSFFHDSNRLISMGVDFVSGFFSSDEMPEGQSPGVSLDQLVQARDHGRLAAIEATKIDKDWKIIASPYSAMENASFQASMVFDRGKKYYPNEIVFGSQVPDIEGVFVPEVEGGPVDGQSEIPSIDLSTIPVEVKSQPQWKRFEQQAALLGQDYTKQKNTLETLKAKVPTLPEASPEREEVEKDIKQAETDLGNTVGTMKKVEKKMMDFFISFKEKPKPADREEEKKS